MGSCPVSEGDDRDLFLAEVSDAATLTDRGRVRAAKAAPKPRAAAETEAWSVETQGHRITARAHGVNRKTLRELAAGKRDPEATIDLHRLDVASAQHKVRAFLADSCAAGRQCVLVVSGRGNHSNDAGVLRAAVLDWVTGPMSRYALALSTATPQHGGDGAFFILLRKA